ncbi:hypothetical protein PIB30_102975, partial [Stylosanthes scabra]|nr:hypothetical protein [Stylosanthes scabra]
SFGQSLSNPTLTLAPSVGNSYSRDRKHSASDLSGRWKEKSQSTTKREAKTVPPTNSEEGSRPEEPNHPATRNNLERALRETNSRSCNRLGSREKIRRAHKETTSRPRRSGKERERQSGKAEQQNANHGRSQQQNSRIKGPHVETIHCGNKSARMRKKASICSHPTSWRKNFPRSLDTPWRSSLTMEPQTRNITWMASKIGCCL